MNTLYVHSFCRPRVRHVKTLALCDWQLIYVSSQYSFLWINTLDPKDIFIAICSCFHHPLSPVQTVCIVCFKLCDITSRCKLTLKLKHMHFVLWIGSLSSGGSDKMVSAAASRSGWKLEMWSRATASDHHTTANLCQGMSMWHPYRNERVV